MNTHRTRRIIKLHAIGRIVSRRSHHLAICVAALFALTMVFQSPAVAVTKPLSKGEEIRAFDSTIKVRKDGTLLVREKITARALGIAIEHGVFREFASHEGRPAPAVRVTDAQLDGQPTPFRMEDANGARRIYLGDPDTPLVTGEHEFTLTYETPAVINEENGRDRLYWNVTGNSWQFPITDVNARVELPEGVPQDAVTVAGYTGAYGATGKDYMFDLDQRGSITFTAGPLARNEGLTVSVEFPLGYVRHGRSVPLLLLNYPGLAAGLLGLFVLLLYWSVSWLYFGKDPAPGPIMARTNPPQDVSAAGVRYLTQMAMDNKTFTTAVVSLGQQGVLTIDEAPDDYILTRTHSDYHHLATEERALAKSLFGGGQTVSLKMNTRRVRKAMDAFRKALEDRYGKYFSTNARFTLPALVISGVAALASLYLELGTRVRQDGLAALVLLICMAGCGALLQRVWPRSLREWKRPAHTIHATAIGPERRSLFVVLALAVALIGLWVMVGASVSWPWAVLLLLYGAINVGFAYVMKAPTPEGRRVLDEIAGFRIHLRKISAAMASSTEQDERAAANFDRYLAYAMALDMETDWGRRLQTAMQEDIERAARMVPQWYRGENFDSFFLRPGYFGRAAAMAAAASYGHGSTRGGTFGGGGTGSGGGASGGAGGFSGGGAGAGGGGGW